MIPYSRTTNIPQMLFSIAVSFAFFLPVLDATPANAERRCHCRTANSELVEVGNYTCIKTNEGLREARCEFVLNNTAWKLTGNLCPIVFNQGRKANERLNLAHVDFKQTPYR